MTLPEIATRLHQLSRIYRIPELLDLADEIRRRPPLKRADPVSTHVTPSLVAKMRAYARQNQNLTQVQIAQHFGVNQGRVSEALRGKRT